MTGKYQLAVSGGYGSVRTVPVGSCEGLNIHGMRMRRVDVQAHTDLLDLVSTEAGVKDFPYLLPVRQAQQPTECRIHFYCGDVLLLSASPAAAEASSSYDWRQLISALHSRPPKIH